MRLVDFDIYMELLKEKSGLVLTLDKTYLLESRLNPVASKWGFSSLDTLTNELRIAPDPKLIYDIVEAMTTNETSFFRDMRPFETFKNHTIPYMLQTRIHERKLRIWCAASSSGQEPYSLAMILKDHETQFSRWNIDILATDISKAILDAARKGLYSQFEVQRGLPIQMLMAHFTKQENDRWQLSDKIMKMVNFQQFNLLDSMAGLGKFDIIFCRNVLIYFDEKTKSDIFARMARQLTDDGLLYLGGAETVIGITDEFAPVPEQRGLYAKKGSLHLKK